MPDMILKNQGMRDVNPLLCGSEVCKKSHRFGPASREYHLIHYIVSGRGKFRTPRGEYRLGKGDLFIIHPGEMTCYEADGDFPWSYIWIGFQVSPELSGKLAFLRRDVVRGTFCESVFRSMLQSGSRGARELFLCAKIYELFSILQEKTMPTQPGKLPQNYVSEARDFIAVNYMKPIRIQSVSDALGLDRRYFCSIFRRETGFSPKRYLVDFRLEKAARLLTEDLYTPTEAACSTGYQDIFNFSKMFKKKYGLAPLYYQKKYRSAP
jgi:AraC-like DNA-binding protein